MRDPSGTDIPELAVARGIVKGFVEALPERCPWTPQMIDGFVFAVATVPDLVRPSEWLEVITDDEDWVYQGEVQAQQVLGALLGLYNAALDAVAEGVVAPCCTAEHRKPALSNFDDDAPLHQWAHGFTVGFAWLAETWDHRLESFDDEEMREAYVFASGTLLYFSSREAAEQVKAEAGDDAPSLEHMAQTYLDDHRIAMRILASLGWDIYSALDDDVDGADEEGGGGASLPVSSDETFAGSDGRVIAFPKPGRNDPCPCGSGKKYKRCCGNS